MRIGPMEIVIIVLIVALVFGISKIPQIGEAIGKGINAFKRGAAGEDDSKKKASAKKASKKASAKRGPAAAVASASGEASTTVTQESIANASGSQGGEGSDKSSKSPEESA